MALWQKDVRCKPINSDVRLFYFIFFLWSYPSSIVNDEKKQTSIAHASVSGDQNISQRVFLCFPPAWDALKDDFNEWGGLRGACERSEGQKNRLCGNLRHCRKGKSKPENILQGEER